jgi:hypothetical protein
MFVEELREVAHPVRGDMFDYIRNESDYRHCTPDGVRAVAGASLQTFHR